MNIITCHGLSPAQIDEIENKLYAFNSAVIGRDDAHSIGFVIRNETGAMLAAIAAYSWAGIAEIKQLWIDSEHRARGWGRALLSAFIAEARTRGVRRVWVATFDFQAPRFYDEAGFVRTAEIGG